LKCSKCPQPLERNDKVTKRLHDQRISQTKEKQLSYTVFLREEDERWRSYHPLPSPPLPSEPYILVIGYLKVNIYAPTSQVFTLLLPIDLTWLLA